MTPGVPFFYTQVKRSISLLKYCRTRLSANRLLSYISTVYPAVVIPLSFLMTYNSFTK